MSNCFRAFEGVDEETSLPAPSERSASSQSALQRLREDIVGDRVALEGPFGERPLVYCDWTASGRCLRSVESYLQREVLPLYGNTHTSTTITGHQSTCFRDEARKIVAQCVNANVTGRASTDLVLFTGNGTTGAVHKLIAALGLREPLPPGASEEDRPVVLVSSYEHHSNLLSWRETVADVVEVRYSGISGVCLQDLRDKLRECAGRRLVIGAFSAASNVTGLLTDVLAVAVLMHRANGLVFFDYATAAPYVKIDMNPSVVGEDAGLAHKDGVYFSGHKFLGGPGCQGVLVVKSSVMPPQNEAPTEPGGGTVFYVTDGHHRYMSNKVEREESGTPNLLADVKMGLVMHVHASLGAAWIEREELTMSARVQRLLEDVPRLVLLGRTGSAGRHLPVFSFLVRFGKGFLHYNFVCALLNDLLGVQSRGGCACAGPMSQAVLGLSREDSRHIELALLDKREELRPGYSRVSFPYWMSAEEVDFVVSAIALVAERGWVFLPQYKYDPRTGEWAHLSRMTKFPERRWLSNFSIGYAPTVDAAVRSTLSFADVLSLASKEATLAMSGKELQHRLKQGAVDVADPSDRLKWFALLSDVNSVSGKELLPLSCVLDPSSWGCAQPRGEEEALGKGTAYAERRATHKLVAWTGADRDARLPRYLQSCWRSPGETAPLSAVAVPARAPSERIPSQVHAIEAVDVGPPVCAEREKAVDGRLLPGQGQVFAGAGSVKARPVEIPKKIMKLVGQAVKDWSMIQDGDRLLLGLSGGKDSLALLHILLALQKRAPVRFDIACCTVDPQTASFDPSVLVPYVESLGLTYHYMSEPIIELAKTKMQGDSLCAFCARFKRGLLYSTCRTHGYNKLVLAQHLDDLAESFYMSLNHNGVLRTMKANYAIEAGDVHVIRPLVYVREKATRDFAKASNLPIVNENCPACFEEPKERARVKKILMQEEAMVPALFFNLRRALLPLMHERTYAAMKEVTGLIEGAGSAQTVVKRGRESGETEHRAVEEESVDAKRTKAEGDASLTVAVNATSVVVCTDDYCAPCYELM